MNASSASDVVVAAEPGEKAVAAAPEKPVAAVRVPTPETGDADELLRLRADCARDVAHACDALRGTFEARFAKERAVHERRWAGTEQEMRQDLEAALTGAARRADERYASEAARVELKRRARQVPPPPAESDLEATKNELDLAYATFEPTLEAQQHAQQQLVAARKAAVQAAKTHDAVPVKVMGQLDVRRLAQQGMTMVQISELQERLRDHAFQPTRVVVDEAGEATDVVDKDDPELIALRLDFGEQVVDEVVRCFRELDAWNPSGRYCVSVPWDPGLNEELALAAVIDRLAAPRRPSVHERTAAFISTRRRSQPEVPPPPARLHNRTQSSRLAAGVPRPRSHSGIGTAAGLRQFFGFDAGRRTGSG